MQIKRLKIQNIASIADAEIDFCEEPLRDAPVFLISGDTGAGKSTLLDAICLALYGRTPRMSSVSKEYISIDADENERLYSNDNAQLLRRGTGWGQIDLAFIGNDLKEYVARWAVQRDYKKPEYKLQREARRMLQSADGVYSENRKIQIEEKILEIVGMDYNQFCRTVMLAQGEFTKFLKSNSRDKAEILEKLTGTSIYSEIGKRIAGKYTAIKGEWDKLAEQTKNISLLSDEEIISMQEHIADDNQEIIRISAQKNLISGKMNWLSLQEKLRVDKDRVASEVEKLEKVVASEAFCSKKKLAEDYRRTEKVRHLQKESATLESILAKGRLLLPEMLKKCEASRKEVEESETAYSALRKLVEEQAMLYETLEVAKINSDIENINGKITKLTGVLSEIRQLRLLSGTISGVAEEIEEKTALLYKTEKYVEALKSPLEEAERKVKECDDRLSKLSISVNDVVKEMRHDLVAGDMCPVCGGKIVSKLEDSYFESVLSPLREEKRDADAHLGEIKAKKLAEEKNAKNISTDLKKLQKRYDKAMADEKNCFDSFKKEWDSIGFDESAPDDAAKSAYAAVEAKALEQLTILEQAMQTARQKQKEAEEVQVKLNRLQEEERNLKQTVDSKKEEREKCNTAFVKIDTDLKSNESRRAALQKEIDTFFMENGNLNFKQLEEIGAHKESEIEDLEKEMAALVDEMSGKKGALRQLSAQLEEHNERRPALEENDCVEFLTDRFRELDSSLQQINQEVGRLGQQLNTDGANRKRVAKILEAMDKMRDVKDRWEKLNKLLGDKDGSRFRSVAQSFILKSLLENANRYMSCFTDRYTLTCNPGALTILVSDCFKPGEPQPSSILSGGECFMASLSLALGLSSLKGGGMGTDIIFIDEGFGSLSSESLGNVMDTLEKLHQIGGRRVGLISHVAEMKERIPVQIHVQRESPALSKVSVMSV